ncbi:MAG: N-methyl-L-tryptophan oxidase [Thermomicrobium sp.]|nr:N-methyl-L-tryptophan oxidase [Thermomicrobium sp.]MDW7982944.1 N-methyl-L-tryptophan oxidase [Thermomicrobium sp.]
MERGRYDVIVAGLGASGSSTLYHLATRGCRVLGLDRHGIPNEASSYHGVTRIIRLCYYESPVYVPLLQRAYENWRALEHACGRHLLHITGSIDAGPTDGWVFPGSLRSCQEHGLEHEVLTAASLQHRFPGYRLPDDMMAVLQPQGGFLVAEQCVVSYVEQALQRGAEVRGCERVVEWMPHASGITVRTDRATYEAEQLIVTSGAWIADLLPLLRPYVQTERQVLGWFQPARPALFLPDRFPVFNMETRDGRYYGTPVFGVPGFKVGRYHHLGQVDHPDQIDRGVYAEDEEVLRFFIREHFPDADGPVLSMKVCIFTNTPDGHFIIGRYPEAEPIIFASPCSGHGFKFASVIGEILADLATGGDTRKWPLDFFGLERFGRTTP